jgi:hypothetical protein
MFQVLEKLLVQQCGFVMENLILMASPYKVRSKVSQINFGKFVSALEGFQRSWDSERFRRAKTSLGAGRTNGAKRRRDCGLAD